MRKKFLFIVLGIVFCSANIGFAQYVSLGLRAGVNASSLLGSFSLEGGGEADDTNEEQLAVGFKGGLTFFIAVGEVLAIQPEILYSQISTQRSTPFSLPDGSSQDLVLKRNFGYISVPLLLRFDTNFGLNFKVGPQVSFLLSQSGTRENGSESTDLDADDFKVLDSEGNMINSFSSFDWGVVGGIGYGFPFGLSMDLRYHYSIAKALNEDALASILSSNHRFQSISFSLAYYLF